MNQQNADISSAPRCSRPDPNLSGVKLVELNPEAPLKDYLEVMKLVKEDYRVVRRV
jgi:hypothetical protein